MNRPAFAAAVLLAALPAAAAPPRLGPPVRLQAAGQPIDVEVGHAAPTVWDFDGDGVPDLLVGQFGGGKLRLYRNLGTASAPRFEGHAWFEAGGAAASVPAG